MRKPDGWRGKWGHVSAGIYELHMRPLTLSSAKAVHQDIILLMSLRICLSRCLVTLLHLDHLGSNEGHPPPPPPVPPGLMYTIRDLSAKIRDRRQTSWRACSASSAWQFQVERITVKRISQPSNFPKSAPCKSFCPGICSPFGLSSEARTVWKYCKPNLEGF